VSRWETFSDAEIVTLVESLEVNEVELNVLTNGREPYQSLYLQLVAEVDRRRIDMGDWSPAIPRAKEAA